MIYLKKLAVALIALIFCSTLAVTSSYAQDGRYWRGDSRSSGRYESNRGRRGRVVTYRSSPRRYTSYYTRSYSYPRVIRYRTYPRYYTDYYPSYNTYSPYYNTYREYPRYRRYPRRSGLSVRFNIGW